MKCAFPSIAGAAICKTWVQYEKQSAKSGGNRNERKKINRAKNRGFSPIFDPGRKKHGHRGEIPPGCPCFYGLCWRKERHKGCGYGIQEAFAGRKLCGSVHQFHAGEPEQLPYLYRVV